MYEYTCPVCGKVTQVEHPYEVRTFCGKACAAKAREGRHRIQREDNVVRDCIYQPESIDCERRQCATCGWNPEVAKARFEAFVANSKNPKPEPKPNYNGEWISADSELPRDGVQVLAYTHTGKIMTIHRKDGRWRTNDNVRVTHWMATPKAPEKNECTV